MDPVSIIMFALLVIGPVGAGYKWNNILRQVYANERKFDENGHRIEYDHHYLMEIEAANGLPVSPCTCDECVEAAEADARARDRALAQAKAIEAEERHQEYVRALEVKRAKEKREAEKREAERRAIAEAEAKQRWEAVKAKYYMHHTGARPDDNVVMFDTKRIKESNG